MSATGLKTWKLTFANRDPGRWRVMTASAMIDTISIKHATCSLQEHRLIELGATFKTGRRNPMWYLKPADASGLPRITISKTPDAIYHVYAECSIPRLLYGHNARLPDNEGDVRHGVEMIGAYVQANLNTDIDVKSVKIAKLHLTRDYQLGDAADNAVLELYDRRLRHFPKRILASEGYANTLYFNGASKRRNCVICIYPKHSEVLAKKGPLDALEAALGNLRIEYRANNLTGLKALCNRFSVKDVDELLTRSLNNRVFQSLENDLHFPRNIDDRPSALTKLLAIYPPTRAQRLFGFCEMRRIKGDAELITTDRERRNFNAARRDCERAGVWLNLRET